MAAIAAAASPRTDMSGTARLVSANDRPPSRSWSHSSKCPSTFAKKLEPAPDPPPAAGGPADAISIPITPNPREIPRTWRRTLQVADLASFLAVMGGQSQVIPRPSVQFDPEEAHGGSIDRRSGQGPP